MRVARYTRQELLPLLVIPDVAEPLHKVLIVAAVRHRLTCARARRWPNDTHNSGSWLTASLEGKMSKESGVRSLLLFLEACGGRRTRRCPGRRNTFSPVRIIFGQALVPEKGRRAATMWVWSRTRGWVNRHAREGLSASSTTSSRGRL